MENIVPALISAVSAIVVAFISRMPARTEAGEYVPRLKGPSHGKWVAAMFVLAAWLVVSPIAIHHDFPSINAFALLALTAFVAAVWPISGWEAAAWVFALHALNSVAEPIARMATGYRYNPFGGYHVGALLFVTALASINALGVAFLSQWRLRSQAGTAVRGTAHPVTAGEAIGGNARPEAAGSAPRSGSDFILQLERLVRLRDAGGLSETEFAKAKQKILGESE